MGDLRESPSAGERGDEIGVARHRFGLRTKFILLTTLAIITLMTLLGYLAVKYEGSILYDDAERQGRLLGETLAIPILNDLIYEQLGLVEEGGLIDNYLHEVFDQRRVDLLFLALLDHEGRVISHNNVAEVGSRYSDFVSSEALRTGTTVVVKAPESGQMAIHFGVPLSIAKKRWGALRFAISLKRVEEEVASTVLRIALLTIILIGGGFIIVLVLSRRFIQPIVDLADVMENTKGLLPEGRVEVRGHDEIAVLGERFNAMIERLRQANQELRRTHEKLVQSEKMASIGILASGVAHEINNPLGGLFNCLDMIKKNAGRPEQQAKYLDLMREGLERIEGTVNKLLWMSRKGEHTPVEVNVHNAVLSVLTFTEYKLRKSGIVFVKDIPEDLLITVDLQDFQQVMLNLFINAMQAMETGGVLTVRGYRKDREVFIEISDTGAGMPREHLIRIFDPFFTTKPPGVGTGLGLWLTYEILRNYSAKITVQSEEGKGSTFIVVFPGDNT